MNPNVPKQCECPVCQSADCRKMPNLRGYDGDYYDCNVCNRPLSAYGIEGRTLASNRLRRLSQPQRDDLSRRIKSCSESCSGNEIPIVFLDGSLLNMRKGVR